MKTAIKYGLAFMLAITVANVLSLSGCSSNPPASEPMALQDLEKFNAKVATDLTNPQFIQLEQSLVPVANVGLAITGNGALVPVNTAGVTALTAIQTAYANKTGITPAAAAQISNAATLGLQASGNSNYVPVTPEAAAAIVGVVNTLQASTIPISQPKTTTTSSPVSANPSN